MTLSQTFEANNKMMLSIMTEMENAITIDNMKSGQTRTISRTCHISYTFHPYISCNIRLDYDFSLKENKNGQLYTDNGAWLLYIINDNKLILLGMITDMQDLSGISICMAGLLNTYIKNYYNIQPDINNIINGTFDLSDTKIFAIGKNIENETLSVLLFPDKLPSDWEKKLDTMQLPMEIHYNNTQTPYYEIKIDMTKDQMTRSDIINIFNEVFNNKTA